MITGQAFGWFTRLLTAAALIGALAGTMSAQTLGELAKQEEARRKTIKAPSTVVITNDTIHTQPRAPQPATGSGTTAAPAPAGSEEKGAKPAAADDKKAAADPKKEEAAWRQRIQAERDGLQRAQTFAEALQSRINALTTDFTARDDPAQRAVIATDRQKALDELDRVKKEIAQHTKAIATIQDEARRASVPPGWLR